MAQNRTAQRTRVKQKLADKLIDPHQTTALASHAAITEHAPVDEWGGVMCRREGNQPSTEWNTQDMK